MTYAQQAADAAGVPRQTWVRKTWKLQDYEAKDLLKGNASENVWERILKGRGPHCGWVVALPIIGAVIGQPVHEFFKEQMRQAAKEADRAMEHERLAQTAYRTLEGDPPGPVKGGRPRSGATAVGAEAPRRVARMT